MRRLLLILLAFSVFVPIQNEAQTAVLREGDLFDLRLSGMPAEYASEFALQYTVNDHGEVRLPLIGDVKAAGLSATDLARAIERTLVAQKIFTTPTAVLSVVPRYVTVGGAVRSPQAVPWGSDLTLSKALTRAGGGSDFINLGKVKLTREGKASFYNLKRADKDPAQNPRLLPGDEVTASE